MGRQKIGFWRVGALRKDYSLIMSDPALGVEVYSDQSGQSVMAYSGKKGKPDFHFEFRNEKEAQDYVSKWHEGLKARAQRKIERREERKAHKTTLKVGDVLRSSWGYEQTNIDYYQVTRIVGNRTIEIREIAALREYTSDMTGHCWPRPGEFIGEPLLRRVDIRDTVSISQCQIANKKEPLFKEPVEVFEPDNWTAYA